MRTIRGRLTAWYATALVLTVTVFGAVAYVAGRGAAFQELDRRIEATANLAAGILVESYRAGNVVVRDDAEGKPQLASDLAATLEAVPDYLVILHRTGRVLFLSPAARALTLPQVEELGNLGVSRDRGAARGTIRLSPDGPTLHFVVRPVTGADPELLKNLALGAVLAAGVILTRSTPVHDLVRESVYRAEQERPLEIPEGAVVVPGSRPVSSGYGQTQGLALYCPIIVKYRDWKTEKSVKLEEWLRFGFAPGGAKSIP